MTAGHAEVERKLIAGLRLAALILAVDTKLVRDPAPAELSTDKLIRAGSALGLWSGREATTTVARLTADAARWERILSVLRHQLDYLRLLTAPAVADPATQAATDRSGYIDFLHGVAAGHVGHARTFTGLPQLANARSLLDLGGGLGAFSRAWVDSRSDRTAVLADLPMLEKDIAALLDHPRIAVAGVDLVAFDRLPGSAEVILLSNVLHLFDEWRAVLSRVVAVAAPGTRLCVFEASADSGPGALFDLQVHIRSGWSGGLMEEAEVTECLQAASARIEEVRHVQDPDDPYERTYRLWIARRGSD